jgi:hypothetical protein
MRAEKIKGQMAYYIILARREKRQEKLRAGRRFYRGGGMPFA